MSTIVHTDGACRGNPGPGGWAWAVEDGPYASGAEADTTNQRMELHAALDALRRLTGTTTVRSDSKYLVDCFNQNWHVGWRKRGWKNSKKEPVSNRDLWEPLIDLVLARGDVTFEWVKGHSGDPMNDAVDQLAVQAAADQTGRRGERFSPRVTIDLTEDAPQRRVGDPGHDPRITGRAVIVAGLRPSELGGYGETRAAARTRAELTTILAAKSALHDDLVVLTGLGLGTEQLAAEAAIAALVPFIAVLPFRDFGAAWPPESRRRYRDLLGRARDVITLRDETVESRVAAGRLLRARDDWMARQAAEAIVVWDGHDPSVGKIVRAWEQTFDADLWVLEV